MADTEQPKSLDEALLMLQSHPPVLVKDKKGQVGNQKTKYADLLQVNEVVLARLNGYGVLYACEPHLLDDGKFVLKYQLLHVASGTDRSGHYPLKLSDNPQSMGSAITYARRYALLAVTGIAAEDEDDDGQHANGRATAQRAQRQRQAPAAEGTAQTAQRSRPASGPALPGDDRITEPQMRKLQATFAEKGYTTPDDKKAFLVNVIGHELASTRELTKDEARKAIDRLENLDEPPGGEA